MKTTRRKNLQLRTSTSIKPELLKSSSTPMSRTVHLVRTVTHSMTKRQTQEWTHSPGKGKSRSTNLLPKVNSLSKGYSSSCLKRKRRHIWSAYWVRLMKMDPRNRKLSRLRAESTVATLSRVSRTWFWRSPVLVIRALTLVLRSTKARFCRPRSSGLRGHKIEKIWHGSKRLCLYSSTRAPRNSSSL